MIAKAEALCYTEHINANEVSRMTNEKRCADGCSNTHPCSCPNVDCQNHGKCCDCVANHKSRGSLPLCMRDLGEQK